MRLPIEKQVSSLEPSRRLKELGVRQESYFAWCPNYVTEEMAIDAGDRTMAGMVHSHVISVCPLGIRNDDYFAAFTVAELGEMLMHHDGGFTDTRLYGYGRGWLTNKQADQEIRISYDDQGDTEADARAKMLIYLIENGLLDPKAVTR